ncbi:hypothetical protein SK128_019836 [Halocaridina rubra]|uniref:Major facilitator superfamily (MFS) profile domain-containing protein n=1 Tax=Halocaridina rubra TaxID=373956 RepID=A0AAN8XEJ0_HALRR
MSLSCALTSVLQSLYNGTRLQISIIAWLCACHVFRSTDNENNIIISGLYMTLENLLHISDMGSKLIDEFLLKTMGWLPARIALAFFAWLGFINLYMTRINLSVIIVAMVKRNNTGANLAPCLITENRTTETSSLASENSTTVEDDTNAILMNDEDVMDWDETTQGLILASFFYGYAMTQIIGGRLAELYGSKWLFGMTVALGGVSAILSPACARIHYGVFVFLRILQGALQGGSWPAMHACIARWIPPLERPRYIGVVYFGNTLSTAITLPICSAIIDAYGWPAAFYITGSLSIIWGFFWFGFTYSTPAEHPRINRKELSYIEEAIRASGTTIDKARKFSVVPWKAIFTSMPMISIIIADTGNKWGMTLFYSHLPKYMTNVLGFSIKSNGAISSLPFAARYIGCITMSTLADWLLTRRYMSIRTARRLFSTIALWCPALMLVGAAYVGCNWKAIVSMFCVGLFFNGAITASVMVNHTDIAPNYAGTLFGISNSLSGLITFMVPVIIGVLTEGEQTIGQWQKVFWTCIPIYIITHIIFFLFCSGTVQPWNYTDEEVRKSNEENDENDQAIS